MPSAASAQTTRLHFKTAITQVYGSTYPLTGSLDLQIFPAGTIRGYYHTSYYKLFIPVAGGRDGDYIWFDIGPSSHRPRSGRRSSRKAARRRDDERRRFVQRASLSGDCRGPLRPLDAVSV